MRQNTNHKPPTTNHGFTLIELMVAAGILVTSLGAFLTTFNSILKSANYSQGISLASTACLNKLEEMISRNFSDIRRMYSPGGTPGNIFSFNTSGLIGNGSINITDRRDLYGGGENLSTAGANWTPRVYFTSLVYDNKMWVMGGNSGSGVYLNDVWYSTNGANWTQAANNTSWSIRYDQTALVYDNKMWVMGGYNGSVYLNDVWYSTNGANWTCALANASWVIQGSYDSVVYDNKMWVIIGGYPGTGSKVWYSTDGINWNQTASSPWPGRRSHTSVVYDNKMWVMGGSAGVRKNDVWWTNDTNFSDGQTWTNATVNAGWSPRGAHASVVYDNKMWVMGGDSDSGLKNDTWYSTNGANWTQATANASWERRYGHSSVVYDNKMWVMGGVAYGPAIKNDVWYSGGYDRILEVLITLCWRQPDGRMFGNVTNCVTSPAQLRLLLSEKNILELRKTFLGKP